jgi:hypothetical protein
VGHQLLEERDAGGAPADERVAGQDVAAVLGVHRRELPAPQVEDAGRIGDGVGRPVDVAEERRVVEQPLDRQLGERPVSGVHLVGNVAAHERAVVQEAVRLDDVRGPDVDVPRGRAVAGRADPEEVLEDLELRPHDGLLLRAVEAVQGLVHVAVGPDLVAGVADALGFRQVVLHGPGRDEEGRPQLHAVQHPEDPVHADSRAEPSLLEVAQAPPGLLRLAEEEPRLGVEVEREHGGRLLAVRPAIAHHAASLGQAWRAGRISPATRSIVSRMDG